LPFWPPLRELGGGGAGRPCRATAGEYLLFAKDSLALIDFPAGGGGSGAGGSGGGGGGDIFSIVAFPFFTAI